MPFIGAGLGIQAGAPSTGNLISALRLAAENDSIDITDISADVELFDLADILEERAGTDWVQQRAAEIVLDRPVQPTGILRMLARAPSGLILTTNWEMSLERSVEANGDIAQTLTVDNLGQALGPRRSGHVRVLHLNGVATEPSTIVLTKSTYESVTSNEQIKLSIRALGAGYRLLFLGHSLDEREEHIRRNVLWAAEQFGAGRHLILASTSGMAAAASLLESSSGIRPVLFEDPDHGYRFVGLAARVLAGPTALQAAEVAPVIAESLIEYLYTPLAVADADEVSGASDVEIWRYRRLLSDAPTDVAPEEVSASRALLLGRPGSGKSQALLRRGRVGGRQALFQRLKHVRAPEGYEDSVAVFVEWMSEAEAFHPGVPRLDRESLENGVYEFLLDGLDEAGVHQREAIVATISELADRFPQHCWVVSSRRLPMFDPGTSELPMFSRFEILTPPGWLKRFLETRGMEEEALDDLFSSVPQLETLIRTTPFYAAAAVETIESQEPLPETALDLAMLFANRGLRHEEGTLRVDLEQTGQWLNRLALLMEIKGVAEIARSALLDSSFGLVLGEPATPEALEWLIGRSLVAEAAGQIGFASNLIQEARAASAIRVHPEGLAILQEYALARVGEYCRVRPTWVHSMDLLLTGAEEGWRRVVAECDPVAVARTVSPRSSPHERKAAIKTIWDWYVGKRLWLAGTQRGELVDAGEAIGRLWRPGGISTELRDGIRASIHSPEPTERGNAIAVLALIEDREAVVEAIPSLLEDPDPVVVRLAAEAAVRLNLPDIMHALADKAISHPDELAPRTLASSAASLARDEGDLIALLSGWAPNIPRSVLPVLDSKLSKLEQLTLLEQTEGFADKWLDHLLDQPEWTDDEVRVLERLLARDNRHRLSGDRRISRIEADHPRAALDIRLHMPLRRRDVWELYPLFAQLQDGELNELARGVDEDTREVIELFRANLNASSESESSPAAPDPSPGLSELIDASDVVAVLLRDPASESVDDLGGERLAVLSALVRTRWTELGEAYSIVRSIRLEEDGRSVVAPDAVWRLLNWSATIGLSLEWAEWLHLAKLPLAGFDEWLRASFRRPWWRQIAAASLTLSARELESVIDALPEGWPASVSRIIADKCFQEDVRDESRRLPVNELVGTRSRKALVGLYEVHGHRLIAEGLARLGVCQFERKVLEFFAQEGFLLDPIRHRAGSGHWLEFIRCRSSMPFVLDALRAMLRRGESAHDCQLLFRALERTGGNRALAAHDSLIADTEIPQSSFLWYEREEAIGHLFEAELSERLPTDLGQLEALIFPAPESAE